MVTSTISAPWYNMLEYRKVRYGESDKTVTGRWQRTLIPDSLLRVSACLSSWPSLASRFGRLDSPLPSVDIPGVIGGSYFPQIEGSAHFQGFWKWVFTNSLSSLQRQLSCLRQLGPFFYWQFELCGWNHFWQEKNRLRYMKSRTVHSDQFSSFKILTRA